MNNGPAGDPESRNQAVMVSGEPSKEAAAAKSLWGVIARGEQRRVADLLGTLEWDLSFDYKAERSRRG